MANQKQGGKPEDQRKLQRLEIIDRALTIAGRALGLALTVAFAAIAILHANAAEWHVAALAAAGACGALAAVTGGGKSD
jgi:hypothetical protein